MGKREGDQSPFGYDLGRKNTEKEKTDLGKLKKLALGGTRLVHVLSWAKQERERIRSGSSISKKHSGHSPR